MPVQNVELDFFYHDKKAVRKTHPFAAIEAKMLLYLREYLCVPKVYRYDANTLVMEYIQEDCRIDETKAAKVLASLHRHTQKRYGFAFDTTIGPYRQKNEWRDDWCSFYGELRVLEMAKGCFESKRIDAALMRKIETLVSKLENYLPKTPRSSLLHGDVWSGNVLCTKGRVCFIDPALYYGHNEVELAFIDMFSTFSRSFFQEYHDNFPIEEEFWEVRKDVYQLYPYLVHVRSFGGGYIGGVKRILQRFL